MNPLAKILALRLLASAARVRRFPALLGVVALLANACESDFDPASRITSFRVLAVASDAPFAEPGETVHLSSLSHDPQQRPITWAWAACVNPDAATVEGCLRDVDEHRDEDGGLRLLAQGEGLSEIDYTVPEDILDGVDAAAHPLVQVGLLSVGCPGELRQAPRGRAVPFDCLERESGAPLDLHEYVVGVKRILVRLEDRNQNPRISTILFDGVEWGAGELPEVRACETQSNDYDSCSGATQHSIEIVVPAPSVEAGRDEFGREFSEMLAVQHYATGGNFEFDSRIYGETSTGWAARREDSGDLVTFYFVVRDDRGGVSWEERQATVL